jgi:hypothetical protein
LTGAHPDEGKGTWMNPEYPVYIVSKGRWDNQLTATCLDRIGVPYHIVVEEQEYKKYAQEINPDKILVLPQKYLDEYDTFSDVGGTKTKGPGAARNYCWDLALESGVFRHWVMDDNMDDFHRMNNNVKIIVDSGTIFRVTEIFVDRYVNVPIAGLNYYHFCKQTDSVPPFILNTRIYSCLLIENDIPYRWRGRYNEDTDLSLRVLKDGLCTIQMNAFLAGKTTTQRMKGGNTEEFYKEEGTLNKSQMLADMHPDVAEVRWKFNRWHHHVDYTRFKKNKLIRNPDVLVGEVVNNYGMVLEETE